MYSHYMSLFIQCAGLVRKGIPFLLPFWLLLPGFLRNLQGSHSGSDDPDDPLLFLRDFYGSAASLRDPLYFPRSFLFSHFFSFLPFIKLAYCPECSDSEQDVYPERQGYIFSCKDAEDYCYVLFHNACPPVSALTGGFSFVVHTK